MDEEYLSAATLSTTFITKQLYNGTAILDTIDIGTCSLSMFLATYNSGFTIDGLSVLASLKKFYVPTCVPLQAEKVFILVDNIFVFHTRLSNLISAVVPNPQWTDPSSGINIEGTFTVSFYFKLLPIYDDNHRTLGRNGRRNESVQCCVER